MIEMYLPCVIFEGKNRFRAEVMPKQLPPDTSTSYAASQWGWFINPLDAMRVAIRMGQILEQFGYKE